MKRAGEAEFRRAHWVGRVKSGRELVGEQSTAAGRRVQENGLRTTMG